MLHATPRQESSPQTSTGCRDAQRPCADSLLACRVFAEDAEHDVTMGVAEASLTKRVNNSTGGHTGFNRVPVVFHQSLGITAPGQQPCEIRHDGLHVEFE